MSKKNEMVYVKPELVEKAQEFYLGLDDVELFHGKKGQMKKIGSRRFMTNKFYNSAKRAAELVFLNQSAASVKDTYDKKVLEDFWKHCHYDRKAQAFIYEMYLTEGTRQEPKPCQMDEFKKGNYAFYRVRHEIQVLKTDLATDKIAAGDNR